MGYKNPILTEIYVEMSLAGEGLGNSFLEIVLSLKELGLSAVELAPIRHFNIQAVGNEDPKVTRAQLPRIRVWNKDKTKLAQLSKPQIAVNLVGKYPGWDEFRNLFDSVLAQAKKKSQFNIESVLLCTIDKTIIPSAGFKLGAYLNTQGKMIPGYLEDCATAVDLILGRGIAKTNGENRQFQVSLFPKGSHFEIVLQSKFQNSLRPTEKVEDVLELLHDESNSTFEDFITDKMRNEIMGGLDA